MKPAPPIHLRSGAGFTLLELIVALVLLGLLSTMALGGVRLGARTWETVSDRAQENSQTQIVRAFLRRELAQAVPVMGEDSAGDWRLLYEGERESLVFVAPLAPYLGLGGYQRLELSLVDDDSMSAKRLVLKRRLFHHYEEGDQTEEDEVHLLLDGIGDLSFAYRESSELDDGSWSEDWQDRSELPELLRLRITFADERRADWPDLLVARRITTQAGCLPAEKSAGCR